MGCGAHGRRLALVICGVLSLAGCGDSDNQPQEEAAEKETVSTRRAAAKLINACPKEGCEVKIVAVSGARRVHLPPPAVNELKVTFEANYTPDPSRNHFHVFWDTFTAKQVSDDAEPRFGVTQGDWVPTGDNPFITAEAVSVAERGSSTTLCVTAGDRDHNVVDPDLVDCRDVSELL